MKKKLIFLGHNTNIHRYIEIAQFNDIEIVGIIDENYFGNTDFLDGLPIIGTEKNIKHIQDIYPGCVYFIATPNTIGSTISQQQINTKRLRMIHIAQAHELELINLIHPSSAINKTVKFGKGILIDALCRLQHAVTLHDHVSIKEQSCLAHHSVIGWNTAILHQVYVGSNVMVGKNCYIGTKCMIMGTDHDLSIGDDCRTHPGVIVMRDMIQGQIAKIATSNGTGIHPITVYD
jgi:UDP-3-O-[3-hydroxymyristoyl] glucosamine N-acyltransferase